MILLDTNAVIWLLHGHRRTQALAASGERLYLSPVSVLELQFLIEVGRMQLAKDRTLQDVANDPRWQLDSPPSDALFSAALSLSWTRDPFDRLLVAHAQHRRWTLATGDGQLKTQLSVGAVYAL